jgi:hypothetical protein
MSKEEIQKAVEEPLREQERLDIEVEPEEEERYFEYLDDLRTSGVTNVFGAGQYLEWEFGLDKRTARAVLTKWMETFGSRHPEE